MKIKTFDNTTWRKLRFSKLMKKARQSKYFPDQSNGIGEYHFNIKPTKLQRSLEIISLPFYFAHEMLQIPGLTLDFVIWLVL